MYHFEPDYRNVLDAACNIEPKRLPLYEHIISFNKIDEINGTRKAGLFDGNERELDEFFDGYCAFFRDHGYDTVSFECCLGEILPGGGALADSRVDPVIKNRGDFERYPWDEAPELYFKAYSPKFAALRRNMPDGMRAVGGVGNGVFEVVQNLTGFENLCYISADDPELYEELFQKAGEISLAVWRRFLREFGDVYCVLRFGDDLGYKTSTMLPCEDIKRLIIPQYARIISEAHSYHKPFLLHSCGQIHGVMDELIDVAKIDAKHSNEDQICGFPVWVQKYGKRIGNFGGIDTDAVCRLSRAEMREYITDVIRRCTGNGGFCFGSGNSIPDYVPARGYLDMVEIVREIRGDKI